ncbi:MAG: trigger factor [Clostridia bacterium]|nr:trigger factor [Clostridia bacterium]
MSLIKVTALEGSKVEIQLGIAKTALDAEVKEVYKKKIVDMNIPGFRKGKAPLTFVKKMYGESVFVDEALNNLLPAAYEEAYKEAEIDAVSAPTFDIVSMDEDGVVVLKAEVAVKPVPKIGEYKGLKVEREIAPVTDEAVEADIASAQKRAAREIEITDRAAEMGDTADINYEGFCDGVPFDGGKDDGHKLKLGSGEFIPGFEDQIVGKNIGEEFDVNVTFPKEYHAKELAGKDVVFKCKLNALTAEELPELDDEFAKDLSFDTFEEYKADVRKKLEERAAGVADRAVEGKLNDQLLEILEVEIPEEMYANETENQVRDYDMQLRQNGLDLNTYFKYTGQTLDNLRENFRPRAERAVKTRLALEAIVAAESLVASDEELEAEYKKLADAYHIEIENVKNAVDAKDLAADVCVRKAFDLVKENAIVTDVAPSTEENN